MNSNYPALEELTALELAKLRILVKDVEEDKDFLSAIDAEFKKRAEHGR